MAKTYSLASDGDIKISDNFKVREFACKDGSDKIMIDTDFVKNKLQIIRDHFNKAVIITSGYRTVAYNRKVGGAEHSYHLTGQAFDIQIAGVVPLDVAKYAEAIGIMGIIVYDTFTHVDSRTLRYYSKNSGKSSTTTFYPDSKVVTNITSNTISIEEAALNAYRGVYGDGETRKKKIESLGLDYEQVRKRVNEIVKERG